MRRFEFSDGSSNKFWEIVALGKELRIRFGKIGSNGQLKLQTFASPTAAMESLSKQVAEKTKKGYVECGAVAKVAPPRPTAMPALKVSVSSVKPTALKITQLSHSGSAPHRMVLLDDDGGHVALATGNGCLVSSDGKKFHRRNSAIGTGTSYCLNAYDGTIISMGGPFAVTKDLGQTWRHPKAPSSSYLLAMFRDAKGNYWLGDGDGLVFTSSHADKGWVKAKFKMPGKVLNFAELDGKLFVVGTGCGVWDGKKLTTLKGPTKKDTITRITEGPNGGIALIGDGGTAFFSKDRGKSFTRVKSGVDDDLEDCAWVAGALFAVGGGWGGAVVVRSDDEGKSWKKVPIKAAKKLWSITSWGDGAFLAGDAGLFTLAAPTDTYWKGQKDRFAPEPAKVDAQFAPTTGRTDAQREAAFAKLYKTAHADHTRLAAKHRAAKPPDENPKLASAVDEGAEGAAEIYADWLSDSGDPRGELAQIQLRLAKDRKNKELQKAEKALLKQHADAWLGKLAGAGKLIESEWHAGFITKARIADWIDYDHDSDADKAGKVKKPTVEQVLEWLLASPSARFLRDLTIGIVKLEDENRYDKVAKIIGTHYLPALRSLYLGDFTSEETELNWSELGNLEPMWGALPNLRTLRLKSGSMKLGTIVLPALEHFEVVTGGGDPKTVKAIAAATWPSLTKLSMQVGLGDSRRNSVKIADLQPILDGERLPRLTHLGITNYSLTHELVDPLASSKILPQLAELDLQMGTLGDESIARMFALQRAFAHLKLNVDDNYIGTEGKALLKRAKLDFELGKQREDEGGPEDRYASAYE